MLGLAEPRCPCRPTPPASPPRRSSPVRKPNAEAGPASLPVPVGSPMIRVRGARTHNLKNIDLDIPRNRAGRHHRAVGLGQVEPRLRHAVRRRPAPLRREPVGLRAAVPAADGQARRRRDRGPVAGDHHRAEGHLAQPALDGRHRHRDPRLPAAAVRPRRHAVLPEHDLPLQAQSVSQMVDATLALPEETRLMVLAPVVRDRKGEFAELFEDMQAQGYVRFRGRRRGATRRADVPKLKKAEKHDIDVVIDRAAGPARPRAAPGRELRGRAAHRRRPRDRPRDGHAAASTCSPASSPARCAAIRCPSSSRGCSRSTRRSAPARPATAWATRPCSTPSASSRFRR